ncbi:copper resistance protein NlpE N-terminal domain-containing protein [Wohlfahrtiimonas chitiniclastica]|uniref:Copper resistance protein NlpE N-terminal domain-containing protein n=1 Tax=Wohlfahrtiimonas chitiniclastica TaxID=400946 RepID=A0A162TW38_9GAMM|nr:copper resistance protein NlpE N-terminal domain-containing protein [Wohlfahrtiimonas chitiniclastica]KZS22500.1 hypothetical protein BMY_0320 [Wohlfahrtiimonas chitiniclastica]KZX38012.1 hypothetical protein A6V30_03760 [Wohlfahrtiimonas chitiniclastica]MBS7813914.1 copper resistance protein NlpE N-terminal domain-containing protein [Wohlfahrtiimonas chitiniclastica]MBS7816177.1 copper resistance protein NlpE N-terminal domain-containing protein [Wohlfahrtiimonas chitiniclastica]MBS7821828
MKKSVITAAMLPLILTGCLSVSPKKTEAPKSVEPVETASQIAQTSLDYPGTYRTRLKCEGCDYTNAQLQVNQYGQYRYIEQSMKNGAPLGQPIVFQGRYTWDKNAPIIRLLNARNMHFFVAENQMVLLDHPVASFAEITSEPKFQKVVR